MLRYSRVAGTYRYPANNYMGVETASNQDIQGELCTGFYMGGGESRDVCFFEA